MFIRGSLGILAITGIIPALAIMAVESGNPLAVIGLLVGLVAWGAACLWEEGRNVRELL